MQSAYQSLTRNSYDLRHRFGGALDGFIENSAIEWYNYLNIWFISEVKSLFGVKYDTWKSVCDMYFSLKTGSLKAYLQWFPFTKLTKADKDIISSEDFFNKYIKTGSFVLFPPAMHQSENFLQKSDGSFRDSSLVGPILYLMLQAVGKEIYDQYISVRPYDVSVYYAGNYEHMRPKYKQDYDDFFKELNASIDEYQYFIKTDITNFFANINVDKLVAQI